jgi:hypothetical protein
MLIAIKMALNPEQPRSLTFNANEVSIIDLSGLNY